MEPAITIELVPARLGDCLLVECNRSSMPPWRMLVDGGPPDTWPALKARIGQLPAADRRLDLVVVTHIDSDHIGGLIPLFTEGVDGLAIHEVWFNGSQHLPDDRGRSRSVGQGESLVAALTGHAADTTAGWNTSAAGAAVVTSGEGTFVEVAMPDGPLLTVLSPTPKRLAILRARWVIDFAKVRAGESDDAPPTIAPLQPLDDLEALAAQPSARDQSAPNGSSIAFLLEHRGASCLLTGDAFGNVLGAGLFGLANHRGEEKLVIDAFKLPHHASKANVISELIPLAPAPLYLISTNGERFHHPDDAALARVVLSAPDDAQLCFNYLNERTERWGDDKLQARYGFGSRYPETAGAPMRIELPARAP
jgi:beta-lactamase superfamily II metal-dependent hydrolase